MLYGLNLLSHALIETETHSFETDHILYKDVLDNLKFALIGCLKYSDLLKENYPAYESHFVFFPLDSFFAWSGFYLFKIHCLRIYFFTLNWWKSFIGDTSIIMVSWQTQYDKGCGSAMTIMPIRSDGYTKEMNLFNRTCHISFNRKNISYQRGVVTP